jgi:hypothetical protein
VNGPCVPCASVFPVLTIPVPTWPAALTEYLLSIRTVGSSTSLEATQVLCAQDHWALTTQPGNLSLDGTTGYG